VTRYGRWSLALALAVVVIGVIVAGLWLGRANLSDAVISDWFATRQMQARYHVTAISPAAAVLDDVEIGPVGHPDFTARRVTVSLGWSLFRPRIRLVTLDRPRLRMTVTARGASFGSLDRLLPGPDDPPQPFPDLDLLLGDGRIDVASPIGALRAVVTGRGNLRDGFVGTAIFDRAALAMADCRFDLASATARIVIERRATRLSSGFAVPRLACRRGGAQALAGQIKATLPPALDSYTARLEATIEGAAAAGYAAGSTRLWIDAAAATPAAPPAGQFGVTATSVSGAGPQASAGQVAATGRYALGKTLAAARLDTRVAIKGAAVTMPLTAIVALARQASGTFAQPLLAGLADNLAGAARRFDADVRLVVPPASGAGRHVVLSGLKARALSGAGVVQDGSIDVASEAIAVQGTLALSGGGLPAATLAGSGGWRAGRFDGGWRAGRFDGGWRAGRFDGGMTLAVGRWATGTAAIDSAKLVIKGDDSGERLDGIVRVSGALGGAVTATALDLPVALQRARDGRIAFGDRCLTIDWRALARADVRLDGGSVLACPTGGAIALFDQHRLSGGARLAPLALRGIAGGAAFAVTSGAVQLGLSGDTDHPRLRLEPGTLSANLGARRFHARVSGGFDVAAATGKLLVTNAVAGGGDLPVRITDASAALAFAGKRVGVSAGTARVADTLAPARFEPIRLVGINATLAGGVAVIDGGASVAVIDGGASIPAGSARLFDFSARHDLSSGRGTATLKTGNLVFGPTLQPCQLTERLRGVVDNVAGTINANARFDWTKAGTTSRGTLRIEKLDLATAALGPVSGIDGTLVFDDLAALTTPPNQTLRVARINPGVIVDDGVVVFRLFGPDSIAIDSIRWPYAGGALVLAPVTIARGDTVRSFRLTAENLDAEQFLLRFDIKNLNVTGRFDGLLPLAFAGGRGRIVGGHLQARPGGGLVQYVGEIGSENIGAGARLAFDALRRLRYRNLGLDLDGDLDGELVTQLHFDGINEASTRIGGAAPIRATGLPFKFNVTVRAPFRALLGTAASFNDVRPLLRPPDAGVQPR
jgi:hypothetical protein